MTVIEAELRRWGNSFGIVIPMDVVEREKMRERTKVRLLVLRESQKVLRETFGMGKAKLVKSSQQIKDELRRELYNE